MVTRRNERAHEFKSRIDTNKSGFVKIFKDKIYPVGIGKNSYNTLIQIVEEVLRKKEEKKRKTTKKKKGESP